MSGVGSILVILWLMTTTAQLIGLVVVLGVAMSAWLNSRENGQNLIAIREDVQEIKARMIRPITSKVSQNVGSGAITQGGGATSTHDATAISNR